MRRGDGVHLNRCVGLSDPLPRRLIEQQIALQSREHGGGQCRVGNFVVEFHIQVQQHALRMTGLTAHGIKQRMTGLHVQRLRRICLAHAGLGGIPQQLSPRGSLGHEGLRGREHVQRHARVPRQRLQHLHQKGRKQRHAEHAHERGQSKRGGWRAPMQRRHEVAQAAPRTVRVGVGCSGAPERALPGFQFTKMRRSVRGQAAGIALPCGDQFRSVHLIAVECIGETARHAKQARMIDAGVACLHHRQHWAYGRRGHGALAARRVGKRSGDPEGQFIQIFAPSRRLIRRALTGEFQKKPSQEGRVDAAPRAKALRHLATKPAAKAGALHRHHAAIERAGRRGARELGGQIGGECISGGGTHHAKSGAARRVGLMCVRGHAASVNGARGRNSAAFGCREVQALRRRVAGRRAIDAGLQLTPPPSTHTAGSGARTFRPPTGPPRRSPPACPGSAPSTSCRSLRHRKCR